MHPPHIGGGLGGGGCFFASFFAPKKDSSDIREIEPFPVSIQQNIIWVNAISIKTFSYLCPQIVIRSMCTISINIDEAVLRSMRPELDTTAAIRLWVQNLVDSHLQQMEFEDTETMSIEEAREMTLAAVREEYARS